MSVTILSPEHWTDKDLANFVRASAKEDGSNCVVILPYDEWKKLDAHDTRQKVYNLLDGAPNGL